ncbi:MAG: bifunctional nuclease family protein [Muribaculaceae bacterium]|nr:bifunctional nuclease family protein [Muribaculaceae bacterium]
MSATRIRLKVLGLSIGQIRQGAYALILAQADGPIRIPVVIGVPEANAIAARLDQSAASRRPMVHDLFSTMTHAFGIALQEVFIYKFEDGVFYSELRFTDGERRVNIDSRTSDAIAIAMRTGAPIYTTPEILQECGFVLENEPTTQPNAATDNEPTEEQLRQMLDEAVKAENYEEAARINSLIDKKKKRS